MELNTTQNLSLEQKLAILSKDFLDRDGETFTFERTEGRLGWEKNIDENGSYSEYILHPESTEELITNAYKVASDMITVMDTPYKVKINITGDQSCTDSKELFVGTKVFDDPDMSVGQKLDTFIGFTVHEGCHLLYTDFKPTSNDELTRMIANIIEDERIERACGNSKPGLVNFLKAAKYYSFDKYNSEVKKKGGFDKLGVLPKLINAILAYIRYPKALVSEDVNTFSDVLLQVKNILTPYPNNPSEVETAAKEIVKAIKDFLKKNPEKQDSSESQSNSSPDSRENKEQAKKHNESGYGSSNESDNSSEENTESNQSSNVQDSGSENSSTGASQEKSSSGNSSISTAQIKQDIQNAMDELRDALKEISSAPKSGIDYKDISDTLKNEDSRVSEVCSGEIERGTQRGSYINKGGSNEEVYKESLDRVKPYISAIGRALKLSSTEYKLSLRGMRNGVLDTGKLAEAFQGVPTVYIRNGEVRTDKVNVCILIDESGSMWGKGEATARDTAVLLNEALNKLSNVNLFIYGHTATRKAIDLFVYREKGFKNKYALGSTNSRAGNRDSVAIREAAARVRKFTKDKCLFFMISDGAPNESTDMVKQAVIDVERDGFSVVAISIDPYYDPSTMYSKNVTISNMSTLALEVGKLVKKAVMENTKKKVNL